MVLVVAKPNLISCNFPSLKTKKSIQPHRTVVASGCCCRLSSFKPLVAMKTPFVAATTLFRRKSSSSIVICNDSNKQSSSVEEKEEVKRDWTTSILLFLLWAALIYYVSFLSPNQTPVTYTIFFFHLSLHYACLLMFIVFLFSPGTCIS